MILVLINVEEFGHKTQSKKSCPRGAFLVLCEEGLIKGIKIKDKSTYQFERCF